MKLYYTPLRDVVHKVQVVALETGTYDGGWGWGAKFFDADNDGDLDLFVGFKQDVPNRLYQNDNGRFTDVALVQQWLFWELAHWAPMTSGLTNARMGFLPLDPRPEPELVAGPIRRVALQS